MKRFFSDTKTIERMKQGPLGHYIAPYAATLHAVGYTRLTGRRMLECVAGFNSWLKSKRILPGQFGANHIETVPKGPVARCPPALYVCQACVDPMVKPALRTWGHSRASGAEAHSE